MVHSTLYGAVRMTQYLHQYHPNRYQTLTIPGHFSLQHGETVQDLVLAYETIGTLNARKDNAILIHHSLSTHSHVCSHSDNPENGWWENLVGPGKSIDTENYFVVCINNLGSCFGSTGPASLDPLTQRAYGKQFPFITIDDMVRSQKFVLDYLGIEKLHAVIGNSMGAMLSLDFAIRYPNCLGRLISVSSCYKAYPVNIAYHVLQKEIIFLDQNFDHDNPHNDNDANLDTGFITARKLGLLSYRHPEELNTRFAERLEINRYLTYNARKFVRQFNVHSYLRLLDAMDVFDVTKEATAPHEPFLKIQAKTLVIAVDTDLLFPPSQQRDLYDKLVAAKVDATFLNYQSTFGHDAFYADLTLGTTLKLFLDDKYE